MIALCLIRPQPHYRREAFEIGLRRAGYSLVANGRPSSPADLLVIWNRYGAMESMAGTWERLGGTVIVCENGYAGRDAEGRQYYALSVHGHNGSGWFPVGDDDRLAKLNIAFSPWREAGQHFLVCGQRGIGSQEMASPHNWHNSMAALIRKVSDRPIKIRLHPGDKPPPTKLEDDLQGAYACTIWSSGSGVKALQLGIPVIYAAPHWICEEAAGRLNGGSDVLSPSDEQRVAAFRKMSWGQRSVSEIESGEPFVSFRERIAEVPKW